jgi:hypothetical protein
MPSPILNPESTFGLWTVIGSPTSNAQSIPYYPCRCACGTEKPVNYYNLIKGKTHDCGCMRKARATVRNYKHGGKGTSEYRVWKHVIKRCTNRNAKEWPNYGGRGITVCDQWRNDFAAFLADAGKRPSDEHTLDRINNDGNYEPGNVRWTTRKQQNLNKRTNRIVTFNGVTQTVTEHASTAHAKKLGLGPDVVLDRLNKLGWSVERALTAKNRFWR